MAIRVADRFSDRIGDALHAWRTAHVRVDDQPDLALDFAARGGCQFD
ncbi:TPA: hypothetical protein QDA71_005520 [Burkholderia vietnamiensis]|jgi:hypothetical protein|nr:hypothetical protein [Burkholderia vietnamiensis]HDR8986425.1 hypothetical protein [Burkholderia vietnamiensis]HDR9005580.1 hypothetical protein [Burkholderia vietnamiensis]HDR9031650.1 hypothetical protein [Burkholderia vietnamiensis]HDR9095606.1 hypothetical protein [Burkholderia vietnamiensis]